MTEKADVVICGAGICGIAAAYHLSVKHGIRNVVLVDEREPMTLTSDKSTECYRNWWPGPGDTMVRFMNRSIDLLEDLADESQNFFGMNRRGYVFLSGNSEGAKRFKDSATEISSLGAGQLRIHRAGDKGSLYVPSPPEGFKDMQTGADLILDPALIRTIYPFITDKAVAMLHIRRAGWLSAQQLGTYLLGRAKESGVELVRGRVSGIGFEKDRLKSVHVERDGSTSKIYTPFFVNASGPFLNRTNAMLGLELPVINELHGKVALKDHRGVVPRHVPLVIWDDPVTLMWSDEDREELASSEDTRWLLDVFPSGVHFRPEGGEDSDILLALWTYDLKPQEPVWPPVFEPEYAEIVLRGLVRLVPGLKVYLEKMQKPVVDGGYYCKTRENRPLIGPLPVEGAFVFGAVSGYGIMASMAGGELLAAHISGGGLPDYAPSFLLSRYEDPAYQELLESWDASSGQL